MARIFRHHVSPVKLTLAAADVLLIASCAFFAEWLRFEMLELGSFQTVTTVAAKLAIPILTFPILLGFGAYQSDAMGDLRVFGIRLIAALLVSLMGLAAIAYLFPVLPLWRSILLMSIVMSGAAVFVSHALFIYFAADSFLGRRVVILGAGAGAQSIIAEAKATPDAALKIVDVVAVPEQEIVVEWATSLPKMRDLAMHVNSLHCDLIVIGDRFEHPSLPIDALISCKLSGIQIMDQLTFFEEVRGYVNLDSVKADWIIFAEGFKGGSIFERALKRLMDIVTSVGFLVATSPVFLLCALLVKLTSRGPVLYRQERVGLNGETFEVLKFRSMRVDAEGDGTPKFAAKNDPRVTPIGGFLRRSRADEIPQAINVLRGDMSFVGPRPERPYFVDQLSEKVPFYQERHCLKPGITGWAQIRYPYGASFEDSRRKLEYDLYYVKNYSIFLDVLIILQTLRVVLFPHGVR
ncbi:MAG: TIGR03013 family PEP-CTERM/XrtA system glycosyltransferase [Kordiimonadaceae bacterium]|nr:TIGR03013 family PEP-CTERM/XrtA system glycosyltransferase [Kordiimonadaceae bacterium]MBO6570433.1 TIGR03013 family PEP-CTERM/XrtA system glycosyltransferase [Kordiimonadaceae bacterium]MBO6965469.1 TIGR03013 family PEP-CTERM/XrtA system glycosyltransferase [Kordiimonadaceae bacterium]